jgi:hypothetical protein
MECDLCGLPDPYFGDGDGIGSCGCPRCACGAAADSVFCQCPPEDVPGWPEDDEDERYATLQAENLAAADLRRRCAVDRAIIERGEPLDGM